MKLSLHLRVVCAIIFLGLFSGATFASAQTPPAVVINEFSSNGGSDWVELLNTTGSSIDLSGWYLVVIAGSPATTTLSGTLPANGILTFAPALNDAGAVINLQQGNTIIQSVPYGSADGAVVTAPGAGQSAAFTSPSTWANGTPTKGWFNGSPAPTIASIVSGINGGGVTTNWGTSGILDSSAATGLYFEKTGRGRVTFTATLNLTDASTTAFLQNLGTYMDASAGSMKFDARTATQLKDAGAEIKMYGLDALGYTDAPSIIVKDDDGNVISGASIVSGVSYAAGTLTFTAAHFTQFNVDNNIYVATSTGDDTTGDGTQGHPYKTIAKGIAAVPTGGTVHVAAGTYNENLIISKSVSLLGPNANVDPNTGSRVAEAVIDGGAGNAIEPEATNVTINGFTVLASGGGQVVFNIGASSGGVTDASGLTVSYNIASTSATNMRAITVESNGSDVSIAHNKLMSVTRDIHMGGGTWTNLKINDNYLYEPTDHDYAMQTEGGSVTGFEFERNHAMGTIHLGANTSGLTMSNNAFSASADAGIDAQLELHDSTITNNTFDCTTSTRGLQIYGDQFGLVPSTNVTMSGNTFSNCSVYAIKLMPNIDHVTLTNNTITNAYDGVILVNYGGSAWDLTGKDIHVNNGSITGSTHFAVNNTVSGTLDATDNYWATTTPANAMSGSVTFSPWWADAAMTELRYTTTTSGGNASTTVATATASTTTTGAGNVTINIPAGTVITGPSSWDGTINLPTATTTTVSPVADSGNNATVVGSIEVGFGNTLLTFDKAVKLTFVGQAGNYIGYSHGPGTFHQITAICTDNTQTTNDLLAAGADCKISNDGSGNLVVWTKHFSLFTTYTQSAIPPSGGGGGGGGGPVGLIGTTNVSGGGGAAVIPTVPTGAGGGTGTGTGGEVLGASAYNFTRALSVGSRGADVTALQQFLIDSGYSIPAGATGYFGAQTRAAVIAFQKAHGLAQVGVVGPLTRALLNRGITPTTPEVSGAAHTFARALSVGSTGADVTALQNLLAKISGYTGPVTGYFGALTKAAVVKYQTEHNISAIGIVGPLTRASLNGGAQ